MTLGTHEWSETARLVLACESGDPQAYRTLRGRAQHYVFALRAQELAWLWRQLIQRGQEEHFLPPSPAEAATEVGT